MTNRPTVEDVAKIVDPEAFGLPPNEDPDSITDRDVARDRARLILTLLGHGETSMHSEKR